MGLRAAFLLLIARFRVLPVFGTWLWCFRGEGNDFLEGDWFLGGWFGFLLNGLTLSTAAAVASLLIGLGRGVCFGGCRGDWLFGGGFRIS
jgi:hypothetical protein